ncbi:MAG TPA: hypothetical protein VGN17_02835 [Bryobacteraceae bacterium]
MALADLTQTTTLQANTSLNLETGVTASGSGGDILWSGTTMTPQGKATAAFYTGGWTTSNFGTISSILIQLLPGYSPSAIQPSSPAFRTGDVFGVHTNGGHYAKVLVITNSGGVMTVEFTTFGVTASACPAGGSPTVTSILNNYSSIPVGFPNYGVAPSSLFVVKGTGLADAGVPVLQSSAAPGIPLTLNGASLTVVVNGVTTHPALYYTSPCQLAAVLPAATPTGTGTLTVTYRGATSAPATILVLASAVGFGSFSQLGTFNSNVNIGIATDNTTGALLTFTNAGVPGETIVLWGTGLGADPADSDTTYTLTPHSINTPLQVYFGGVLVPLLYQGSSGYPGVDLIIFNIPSSVPNGCYIPLVAVTGSIISNVVNLPVNSSAGACVEPLSGYTGSQILSSTQDTLKTGLVSLVQTNSTDAKGTKTQSNSANASFQKYSGLLAAATGQMVSQGGCVVGPVTAGGSLTLTGLDPGAINLTGPAGFSTALGGQLGIKGAFSAALAAGVIPSSGGAFTFKGSGGADVGSFNVTLTLANPLFVWTNPSVADTIVKTQGLSVTWTGGNPGTNLFITGTVTSNVIPVGTTAGFTCRADAQAGQFTVPSYILLGLPAGSGGVNVQNAISIPFSASGLDQATAQATISYGVSSTYQ